MQEDSYSIMKSINFEFLRPKWPELAGLGGFAEAYAHSDPVGAILKLRVFCEQFVQGVHYAHRLPKPYQVNLVDLLNNQPFKDLVPNVVLSKLHALHMEGNRAAHGNKRDTTSALRLMREAHNVGRWIFVNYGGGNVGDCTVFEEPPQGGVESVQQRREKRAILERITAQEAQMQKMLADLEQQRLRADQAELTADERKAALQAALQATRQLQAIDPMAYNEEETRKYLIDQMLADEGWDVGKGMTSTAEVVKEAVVKYQVGSSGEGKVDYVLEDDNGKPLGVVEAKKTACDPQLGRKQAEQYADGLEKEHGQRPVIFYTNGYDLWIWNDAAGDRSDTHARALDALLRITSHYFVEIVQNATKWAKGAFVEWR